MSHKRAGRAKYGMRRLWAEQLENRALLAGNVTASVRGSTLVVRGDSADNQIGIVQLDTSTYAVVGVVGTSVNGDVDGVFVSNRPVSFIDADLGRGNDLLGVGNNPQAIVDSRFDFSFDFTAALGDPDAVAADVQAQLDAAGAPADFTLARNLTIRMGDGIDGVAVIGAIGGSVIVDLGNGTNNGFSLDTLSSVGGSLIVTSRGGADEVVVQDSEIRAALTASLGDGANLVTVANVGVGGSAVINTGKHVDVIDVVDTDIRFALVVNSGAGDDDVHATVDTGEGVEAGGAVVLNSGAGNDHVEFSGEALALTITTAAGSDAVDVFDSFIRSALVVNTGDGVDALNVFGDAGLVEVGGSAILDAGGGNDDAALTTLDISAQAAGVFLENLDVGASLIVRLGSGDDTLEVNLVTARNATVDAGAGNDIVTIDASDVDNLFTALMGSGNDSLSIFTSTAAKIGLNGGAGTDDFLSDIDPDNPPPGLQVLYFLSFEGP